MGAGGSHPQATMMPDPWATYSRPSASDNQAMTRVPLETDSSVPENRTPFASKEDFVVLDFDQPHELCRPIRGVQT